MERLTNSPNTQYPDAFAPDGTVVVQEARPGTDRDLFRLRLARGTTAPQAEPLIQQQELTSTPMSLRMDGGWRTNQIFRGVRKSTFSRFRIRKVDIG